MTDSKDSIDKLVGVEFEGSRKWYDFVDGENGYFYGIPYNAHQVLKFDPKSQTAELIGPDWGDGEKWACGVLASNKNIYCTPSNYDVDKILKINTSNHEVEIMNELRLPESGRHLWYSGALAKDGCIYYMPGYAKRILKFDPQTESVTSVGNDFGGGLKFRWTLLGRDNHMYGLNRKNNQLTRLDVSNPNETSVVKEITPLGGIWAWNRAAMGNNGFIYYADDTGNVCEIDPKDGSHSWIKLTNTANERDWGDAVVGADGNIYWPPNYGTHVLILNMNTKTLSLMKCQEESIQNGLEKYIGGVLDKSSGYIYCAPYSANQILRLDTRLPRMTRKSAVGGTNDSPKLSPDRLGYHVYAEGLSEVVRKVENPMTSLCVGLFAPWGAGKTFFWKLIRDDLEQKTNEVTDEKLLKEINIKENAPIGLIERSCVLAWAGWCGIAHILAKCMCFSCKLKAEEKVAVMMIFVSPIGIVVWIIIFALNIIIRPVVLVISIPFLLIRHRREFDIKFYVKLDLIKIAGLEDMTRKNNDMVISRAPHELKWSDVRNIFSSNFDLYAGIEDMSQIGYAGLLFVILLSFFQQILMYLQSSWSSIKAFFQGGDYEIEKSMTKYIFVEFNAWVYSGTDNLWAKLLEQLWLQVEEECGKYQVRKHRASISLSKEGANDDISTKNNKRDVAIIKLRAQVIISTFIWIITISIIAISQINEALDSQTSEDWQNSTLLEEFSNSTIPNSENTFHSEHIKNWILGIASISPAFYFYIQLAIKVVPELYQSRGTQILKNAHKFENHKRPDFSQETGFMGEVSQEVQYLFDFLRTHYVRDEKLKRRRPIRLGVFIDDLDRCPQQIVMKILEATILLLVDAPITCWLAIDSRLVVASIEEHFGDRFKDAGLGGYQYLEKIVQIPFCIPDLDDDRKRNFVEKSLEDTELDPLRVYERLKYLASAGIQEIKEVCPDIFSRSITTKEEAFEELIDVLEEMNRLNIWNNHNQLGSFFSSPEKAVANASNKDQMNESNCNIQRIQDEVLHWISRGIEAIISKRKTNIEENIAESRTLAAVSASNDNNNPPDTHNDPIPGSADIVDNAANTQNPSVSIDRSNIERFRDTQSYRGFFQSMVSKAKQEWFGMYSTFLSGKTNIEENIAESRTLAAVSASNDNNNPPETNNDPIPGSADIVDDAANTQNPSVSIDLSNIEWFRDTQSYGRVFQSMVSKAELEWFGMYSIFLSGKVRKIKRIINSYMVSRLVTTKIRGESERVSYFHKKLLKLTILLEQWPYRMAWILLIVENLQQEKNITENYDEGLHLTNGKTLTSLVDSILEKESIAKTKHEELPLIFIYRYLVSVLMHSSDDSAIYLQRDEDAQMFEQILLHDQSNKMTVKDISLSNEDGCEDTLRPYAFNLQRHTVEKVGTEMENLILFKKMISNGNTWYVAFEKKNEFHRIKKRFAINVQEKG